MRESVAGGIVTAKRQLVDELRMTTPDERQEFLKKANIVPTISHSEGLAIKADLTIPWSKLRHLRRYVVNNIDQISISI